MSLFKKFASRSPAEQWLLLRSAAALSLTVACVRLLPFRLWRGLIAPTDAIEGGQTPRSRPSPEKLAWAVATSARYLPAATCLPQAIAGYRLLRRAGYAPRLRIGITAGVTPFEAHAWLELDGRVLLGGTESAARYAALPLDLAGTCDSAS